MKQMMIPKLTRGFALCGLIGLALVLASGCSALKSKEGGSSAGTASAAVRAQSGPTYYDFGDVLVPRELSVNKNDSFVYRTPDLAVGMLSLKGRVETRSLASFFENKMPVDGWRLVSSIEGQRTMMLFQKSNRWCIINITGGQFSTTAEIWVSTSIDGGTGLR